MKRSGKIVLLLAVMIVLAVGYKLVIKLNETKPVAEEAGAFVLTDKTADDITAIKWTKDDTVYSFTKTDGAWIYAENAAFPLDREAVGALADDLIALEADRKLENVENRADYGLETPAFTVTAQWSDGTSTEYAMGDETPFADGWYFALSNDEAVYTVGTSLVKMFSATLTDLAALEELLTVETVRRIVIGDRLDASRQETSTTLDSEQLWYDTASGKAISGSIIDTLTETVTGLSWNSLIYPVPTEEETAACGLNDGDATLVALTGDNDEAVRLLIGAADESGNYYARLENSAMIYTVSSDTVTSLIDFGDDDLYAKDLFPLTIEETATVEFISGDDIYMITYEKTEPEDEEGETLKTATVNGEEADPAQIETLWTSVKSIKRTAFVTEEVPEGSVLLTVTVTNRSGISVTYEFSEYDAASYRAAGSDGTNVLVSADTIDKIIRTLRQL